MSRGTKRVVVWGTGFVGKMVIAEIVKHPLFELVGVGVSNPDKIGRDVGDICGLPGAGGRHRHRRRRRADRPETRRVGALRPDGDARQGQHLADHPLPAGRHRRVLDRDDPWVWPTMHLNPPSWIAPITEACELGQSSCFTTGIDPGFANDLFPMTLMGLCSEVRRVNASELLDYTNYEGDYEVEMGIGREPEYSPMLEDSNNMQMIL